MNCLFNPETNAGTVRRRIALEVRGEVFEVDTEIPHYIFEKLNGEDWDRVLHEMHKAACGYLHAASKSHGPWHEHLHAVRKKIATLCRERIYERFCDRQFQRGNDAWEVPATLQAHTVH